LNEKHILWIVTSLLIFCLGVVVFLPAPPPEVEPIYEKITTDSFIYLTLFTIGGMILTAIILYICDLKEKKERNKNEKS